jgi:hypothetical protein
MRIFRENSEQMAQGSLLADPPTDRMSTTCNQRVRTHNLTQHNYSFIVSRYVNTNKCSPISKHIVSDSVLHVTNLTQHPNLTQTHGIITQTSVN